MATKASFVRKGTFTLTIPPASAVTFSCQPTAVTITPEGGDVGDSLEVLCGDTISGESAPTTWKLNLTSIQSFESTDTSATSLVLWALENDGATADFEFQPGATTKTFTGQVKVVALPIGGEVGGTAPTSEAEWPMLGKPVIKAPALVEKESKS